MCIFVVQIKTNIKKYYMTRWEYKILDCVLLNNKWRPWQINGVVIKNYESLNVLDTVNKLGDEGWELVGYTGDGKGTAEYWVFKRQK